MPNTFSMAPRYVRDFAARTAFASPERDVFDGLEKKLARLHREPLPADARDRPARRRPRRARRGRGRRCASAGCRSGPGSSSRSPPYLRVVKYGYYNWLRTWFLGLDARAIDATLDDAHHREPYLVVPARGPRRPPRRSSPTTRSSSSSSATSRPTAAGRSGARSGSPSGSGSAAAEPEGYRLAGIALDDVAAGRKMTKLWGAEAGQATKTDRILVLGATEAGRRRALAGAAHADRLGLAAARAARALTRVALDGRRRPPAERRSLECRHEADVPPVGPGRRWIRWS